jgi:hypothetical protein
VLQGPDLLGRLRVARPCDADWNGMAGNERVRFCGECQKHVYNLSALTRVEAEALIVEKEEGNSARTSIGVLTARCSLMIARSD